jgi:hypothetical protein
MEGKTKLEQILATVGSEATRLAAQLDDAQKAGHLLVSELREAGEQFDLTANLYVQVRQLHSSLSVPNVVTAIIEALINLIGSEDFALFVRGSGEQYENVFSFGASRALGAFKSGEGVVGRAAASGELSFGDPIAVVPLKSGMSNGSMGVIVIARLLHHRAELGERDHALLDVLGAHAGLALEAALLADSGGPIQHERIRELCASLPVPGPLDLSERPRGS